MIKTDINFKKSNKKLNTNIVKKWCKILILQQLDWTISLGIWVGIITVILSILWTLKQKTEAT
jgi:hypothetical protein